MIQLLEAKPTMTLAEVAVEIKKSLRAVELASAKLVKQGLLRYASKLLEIFYDAFSQLAVQ